jgi:GNAT superfamily N-acetyltransferase
MPRLTAPVRVVAVAGRRAVGEFLRLPWTLYRNDPAWVPPLLFEQRRQLSPRHPYFQHARTCQWVARRGSTAVGRISAQIDRLHLERHQDDTGFFGMLDADDDAETFGALLGAAEAWLRRHGIRRVRGPFDLSINQQCGLLVDGFDSPPAVMMPHGRPYYAARLEQHGYAAAKDLLAYRLAADFELPHVAAALRARAGRTITVRALSRARFREDIRILRDIFEDAWAANWGFVPFTEREFTDLAATLRRVVPDDFIGIADVDGQPAGMIVLLPDVNQAIRDLHGRLLPLGWLKLLWRLGMRRVTRGRVVLMGVRARYQRSPRGLALALALIEAARRAGRRRGITEVELSWILEDNAGMLSLVRSLGARLHKRYRIYDKSLG